MWQGSSFTFITITLSIVGVSFNASSEISLRRMCFPALLETFEVINILQSESFTLPLIASALNPPKMIEWIAPILVQASITIASSGTIGI